MGTRPACSQTGKVCYASRAEATSAGRQHGSHGRGYRCPHCGFHHFTSQPKRLQRAIRYLLDSLP